MPRKSDCIHILDPHASNRRALRLTLPSPALKTDACYTISKSIGNWMKHLSKNKSLWLCSRSIFLDWIWRSETVYMTEIKSDRRALTIDEGDECFGSFEGRDENPLPRVAISDYDPLDEMISWTVTFSVSSSTGVKLYITTIDEDKF